MFGHVPNLLRPVPLYACLAAWCAASCCAQSTTSDPLRFDASSYTTGSVTVDGQTVAYRAYEGIVYVAKPMDARHQCMNVYIPSAYYEGKTIRGYSAETAPIFLPNMVGGYMPGPAGRPGMGRNGGPNAISAALAHGYVVAAPAARGSTLRDASGANTGKAPACIVDLKAAVRYLRHNDKAMPGSAERIVSNGTSAGGALSALLGATGNHADYEPYLRAIGSAAERDDILAASCYCPITNLENADAAYEWLFHGLHECTGRGGTSTMTAEQIAASDALKRLFPPYLNSLKLKSPDGAELTLGEDGAGPFRDYAMSYVAASAQNALDGGADVPALTWLTLAGKTVKAADFAGYGRFATRMKAAPAFDSPALATPENSLFGDAATPAKHFTAFGKARGRDHPLAAPEIIRMMNPMPYIGDKGASTARHWRIRHGVIDRDTSIAIPIVLATKLRNAGLSVDFALPWGVGHSGDYDLPELFAWIDQVCR